MENVEFIYYVNKNKYIDCGYKISSYFETVSDITIINLKIYYLRLLTTCAHIRHTMLSLT